MTSKGDIVLAHPWISGKPFTAGGGKTEDLLSPWDGSHVATVEMANEATIDAAIKSARSAFDENKMATPAQRALWLRQAADEVDGVKEQIANITMRALGKPKRACGFEAGRVSQLLRLCAEELLRMEGEVLPCLLYTSPSPRDGLLSRMPSSA